MDAPQQSYYCENRWMDLGHGEEVAVAHEELDNNKSLYRTIVNHYREYRWTDQRTATKIDGRTSAMAKKSPLPMRNSNVLFFVPFVLVIIFVPLNNLLLRK